MPETRKISFTQPPFESDDADFSSFPRSCVGMPGYLSTSNQPKAAHRFPRRSMGTRNRYTLFSARCVDSRLRGNDGVFLSGIGVVGRCHDLIRGSLWLEFMGSQTVRSRYHRPELLKTINVKGDMYFWIILWLYSARADCDDRSFDSRRESHVKSAIAKIWSTELDDFTPQYTVS